MALSKILLKNGKRVTPKKRKPFIVSSKVIMRAGGLEAYSKKVNYDSSKVDMSLHDKFTESELKDILNYD
jgi:hypothetical protein